MRRYIYNTYTTCIKKLAITTLKMFWNISHLRSVFSIHYSVFSIHYSVFSIQYSMFSIHYSVFSVQRCNYLLIICASLIGKVLSVPHCSVFNVQFFRFRIQCQTLDKLCRTKAVLCSTYISLHETWQK